MRNTSKRNKERLLIAATIVAGLGTSQGALTILEVGSGNTINSYAGAIGFSNAIYTESLAIGQSNTAYEKSLVVGYSNHAALKSIAVGTENDVGLGQYDYDYVDSGAIGAWNKVHAAVSFAAGEDNVINPDIYYPASKGHILLGRDNTIDAWYGLSDNVLIGKNNYAACWGGCWLLGDGLYGVGNATVVGRYNDPTYIPGVIPAFVVATGEGNPFYPQSIERSNALIIDTKGRTFLAAEDWDPIQPLDDPNPGTRNALTVQGHTVLQGKVIIDQPQGNISMGNFE